MPVLTTAKQASRRDFESGEEAETSFNESHGIANSKIRAYKTGMVQTANWWL
jgi:hypothetical protein